MKPKLRFRGYTDEWEEKKLGEVAEYNNDKNKEMKFKETFTNSAEYGIISQSDFFDRSISNVENIAGYYIVESDDFVYNPRISNLAPYGPIRKNNLKRTGVMSPLYLVFKIKDQNKQFMEQYFRTTYWHKYIYSIGDTGVRADRVSIKKGDFFKMPISAPSLPEQEKIGSFLSKIDERIELEEKKLSLLNERKRGWMQKLFNQEIRFKDENGNDYPDWEKRRVLQFGEIITGNTPSKKQQEYYSDTVGYPWITPTDITGSKNIDRSNLFLTDEGYEKARALPKNTLLVTCIASIGKNAVLTTQGSCNQQINAIIPNDSYNVDFLYYLMEFNKKIIELNAGQTATKIINKNDFSTLEFKVASLPEQEKIAEFLSKQDELISAQERKVSLLKEQKKGLLQQMFV